MKKPVFKGKLLKLYKSRKKLPNGRLGYFEEIEHPGAALVIPFVGNEIVFIRQYRGVIGRYIWELPAGTLEKGESIYSCAKREVIEETGYVPVRLKKLGVIYTSPGFCTEIIHIYRAECESAAKKCRRDSDEVIRVKCLSKAEVRGIFRSGKITDSKTISALALAGLI